MERSGAFILVKRNRATRKKASKHNTLNKFTCSQNQLAALDLFITREEGIESDITSLRYSFVFEGLSTFGGAQELQLSVLLLLNSQQNHTVIMW